MKGIDIIKRLGGGSSQNITLHNKTVIGSLYAQWRIGADGRTYARTNSGPFVRATDWISPLAGMSLYEVKAHPLGDIPPGDTVDAWLDMASDHTWGWENEAAQHIGQGLQIQIRDKATATVRGSCTIWFYLN